MYPCHAWGHFWLKFVLRMSLQPVRGKRPLLCFKVGFPGFLVFLDFLRLSDPYLLVGFRGRLVVISFYLFLCVSWQFMGVSNSSLSINIFVHCPTRAKKPKSRFTAWRRTVFRIIVRKRAARLRSSVGRWLQNNRNHPRAPYVRLQWSRLGSLLNLYPTKVLGTPSTEEIRLSFASNARRQ